MTRTTNPDLTITRGSGNVFADLGLPDAVERQTKLELALVLTTLIARRRLTQTAAAERLIGFLAALGQDVEIVVKDRPRARGTGRVSVKPA